ncbi:chaplin family protein [Streptomyces sp. UMAF16]|nr:chaplin family protein [Streptomyces sp. UMAF16]
MTVTTLGAMLAPAAPAAAGGIGDFLSPAFGTSCANLHTGAHATGTTSHGTGAANGNLAGLPLGSPLNQCGGADLPDINQDCKNGQGAPGAGFLNLPVNANVLQCADDTVVVGVLSSFVG